MRRRLGFLLILGWALIFTLTTPLGAQSPLVDADSIRVDLGGAGQEAVVTLGVRSFSGIEQAMLHCSLLDPASQPLWQDWAVVQPRGGRIRFRSSQMRAALDLNQLHAYRLRFRLSDAAGEAIFDQQTLSLHYLVPAYFDLRLTFPNRSLDWSQPSPFHVLAHHPFLKHRQPDVDLKLRITWPGGERTWRGRTGPLGLARFEVSLPSNLHGDIRPEYRLTGTHEGITRDLEGQLSALPPTYFLISHDKPFYQPGQSVRTRALLRAPAGTDLEGHGVLLTVEDPEGLEVHRSRETTSQWGVVATEFLLSGEAPSGTYTLKAACLEPLLHCYPDSSSFGVQPYELPLFRVSIETDRPFYLPGQVARLEIAAEYLSGRSLEEGRVSIEPASRFQWNPQTREYETREEGPKLEAPLNPDGTAHLALDLRDDFSEVLEQALLFRDIGFLATVRDLQSGRHVQQRFDIRLSRQSVHVLIFSTYLSEQGSTLYLSASSASGEPLSCRISLRLPSGEQLELQSNRFGIAKGRLALVERFSNEVTLDADCGNGRQARSQRSWLYVGAGDSKDLSVEAPRSLYRPGEELILTIRSPDAPVPLLADVLLRDRVLDSFELPRTGGETQLRVPYEHLMAGVVGVRIFDPLSGEFDWESVWYAPGSSLRLQIQPDDPAVRPGLMTGVDLHLTDSSGEGRQAALALSIVDQAVHLRATSEGEDRHGFSVTSSDPVYRRLSSALDALSPDQPIPADLDLAVEAYLGGAYFLRGRQERDSPMPGDYHRIFAELLKERLRPIAAAVKANASLKAVGLGQRLDFDDWIILSGGDPRALRDPWERPLRTGCGESETHATLQVLSAGPDGKPGNRDDFQAGSFRWSYLDSEMRAIEAVAKERMQATLRPILDMSELRPELRRRGLSLDLWRTPCGERIAFFLTAHRSQQFFSAVPMQWAKSVEESRFPHLTATTRAVAVASWDYSAPLAKRLDAWAADFRREHGHPFPDELALRRALAEDPQLDPSRWRDHLSQKLLIETYYSPAQMEVRLLSVGPDGRRDAKEEPGDDFVLWTTPVQDFFASWRPRALEALTHHQAAHGSIPAGVAELWRLFEDRGLKRDSLRDPWGRPVEINWEIEPVHYVPDSRSPGLGPRGIVTIQFVSPGSDGRPDTADDLIPIHVSALVKLADVPLDKISERMDTLQCDYIFQHGLLEGRVADASGAAIPGAIITAEAAHGFRASALSSDNGQFSLRLPGGLYRVSVDMEGFRGSAFQVMVDAARAVNLKVELEVGDVSETVTVQAEAAVLSTSEASGESSEAPTAPLETPRLRHYFPEALFWTPELITDEQGRARIEFPTADSITTWRISGLASTLSGDVTSGRAEFRTFQPFFAQLDPPAHLTEGDAVELPVQVRNYRDQEASLELRLETSSELRSDNPVRNLFVGPQQSQTEAFRLSAQAPAEEILLTLSAASSEVADAVQRTLQVRPLGEEVSILENRMTRDAVQLTLDLPEDLLPEAKAWLTIYPGVFEHLLESREALLRRPWGCAEQITSVSWVNLWVWRRLPKRKGDQVLKRRARAYIEDGVRRLLRFQAPDGGFRYFRLSQNGDVSLTASAARFLQEASDVVDVPADAVPRALSWTLDQEQFREDLPEPRVAALLAREWAAVAVRQDDPGDLPGLRLGLEALLSALQEHLEKRDRVDAYILAHVVAARILLDPTHETLPGLSRKLLGAAQRDAGMLWWNLYGVSPFGGWGRTGTIELTAIALQALDEPDGHFSEEVSKGRLFLLRNKDLLGAWFSTRATVESLRAIGAADAGVTGQAGIPSGRGMVEQVKVNGMEVEIPDQQGESQGPFRLDLSSHLTRGVNRVGVWLDSSVQHTVLLRAGVQGHRPWPAGAAQVARSSRALRLEVDYSDAVLSLGQEGQAEVRVARLDQGLSLRRGMLLAEIGLPPASEVDRDWLDDQWRLGLRRYEVHPDRVVCYLWPRGGEEVRFSIRFRPRLRMQAWTTPSRLYDYYNPQAALSLAPTLFRVR